MLPLIRALAIAAALTVPGIVSVPAKTHVIKVWPGYYQFLPAHGLTMKLGDTVQWLPLHLSADTHTITSTSIPPKAKPFDQIWKSPADTFFQYVPEAAGVYEYECTPHRNHRMKGSFTVQGGTGIPRKASPGAFLVERRKAASLEAYDLAGKQRKARPRPQ